MSVVFRVFLFMGPNTSTEQPVNGASHQKLFENYSDLLYKILESSRSKIKRAAITGGQRGELLRVQNYLALYLLPLDPLSRVAVTSI